MEMLGGLLGNLYSFLSCWCPSMAFSPPGEQYPKSWTWPLRLMRTHSLLTQQCQLTRCPHLEHGFEHSRLTILQGAHQATSCHLGFAFQVPSALDFLCSLSHSQKSTLPQHLTWTSPPVGNPLLIQIVFLYKNQSYYSLGSQTIGLLLELTRWVGMTSASLFLGEPYAGEVQVSFIAVISFLPPNSRHW